MSATVSSRRLAAVVIAVALAAAGGSAAGVAHAVVPPLGTTAAVSIDAVGAVVPGWQTSMSADGRFVAFVSAEQLTSTPTGGHRQVYVKELQSGATRMVTDDAVDPNQPGDDGSANPVLSADGRFVAFESESTNLASGVPSAIRDRQIYLHDVASGTTRLLSMNASHTGGGDTSSYNPSISADGSRVLFDSPAGDLVPGVSGHGYQVYVALTGTSTVALVSQVGSTGAPANAEAYAGSLSADGSVAAYSTKATNLTGDNTHGWQQVFVRDLRSGATRVVSLSADGGGSGGNSDQPTLSADGQKVAYTSGAKDLTVGPRLDAVLPLQVYVRDLGASSLSTLVSVDIHSKPGDSSAFPGSGLSREPAISADGSSVSFTSQADELISPAALTDNQVYHRDLRKQVTVLVSSRVSEPTRRGDDTSYRSSISSDGRLVAFTSQASGLVDDVVPPGRDVAYVRAIDGPKVVRIGGADRYEVSANVSMDAHRPDVPLVYVASGQVFPDALAASAAAGIQSAPVLLATHDTVQASVLAELRRLRPGKIVVLGGTNTISAAVESQLRAFALDVSRIDGADRFEVAVGVSRALVPTRAPVAYVASGEVFPDALAGAAAAGHLGGPVLLVSRGSVPDSVRDELRRIQPARIVVLGGVNTVSEAVVANLGAIAPTTRLGGPDRFAVAAAVSADAFPGGASTVYVASGAVFPDALSGGAAAVNQAAPVLLVTADAIPAPVAAELDRLNPTKIVVLGGTATVSSAVQTALDGYLTR
ncbi:cell wall-binding repeat-containing protein [Herbiconiux sp. 11R-BC]|uniref:cell wall-binding repeat-containing protein n=1 Tax=Herbiconiux sp. 11R-BC TaxID=3111637 RepID=UPI003C06F425